MSDALKFIADYNVGKLARWLRLMGFDTVFFDSGEDFRMVAQALAEDRIILTRDHEIARRRLVAQGRLKVIVLDTEDPVHQMRQVVNTLDLSCQSRPFTRCLEDNHPLVEVSQEEVKDLVPPYVYLTQNQYVRCPACGRIYWKGTHWEAMLRRVNEYLVA